MLKLKNAHPNDERIWMDEGPHQYYIDEKKGYTSATTLAGQYFSKFDSKKQSVLTAKKTGQTQQEVLDEWEEARAAGTRMHKRLEDFYNEAVDVDQGWEEECIKEQFDSFHASVVERKWEMFRTEWMIWDPVTKVCGCIDAVYIDTSLNQSIPDWLAGKCKLRLIIIDWKRCKKMRYSGYRNECGTGPCKDMPACNFVKYSLQQWVKCTTIKCACQKCPSTV